MPALKTTHNLEFESAPWPLNGMVSEISDDDFVESNDPYPDIPWQMYRVGTVEGQWRCTPEAYEILSFLNTEKGNGHLDDVFEWFEFSCKRDNRKLVIRELMNKDFKRHLIEKRGFSEASNLLMKSF